MLKSDRRFLKCVLCKGVGGGAILCSMRNCWTAYHPWCAAREGLDMEHFEVAGNVRRRASCAAHSQSYAIRRMACANCGVADDDDDFIVCDECNLVRRSVGARFRRRRSARHR